YTTFFSDVTGATEVFPGFGAKLEDKALMTVDNHVGSPFQDRVYVTWTEFDILGGTAYIYEVHSDDYGETFSQRTLVSPTGTTATGASRRAQTRVRLLACTRAARRAAPATTRS